MEQPFSDFPVPIYRNELIVTDGPYFECDSLGRLLAYRQTDGFLTRFVWHEETEKTTVSPG